MKAKWASSRSPKLSSVIFGKLGRSALSRLLLKLALVCLSWNGPIVYSWFKEWFPEKGQELKRWKTHLKSENLHLKGTLMCLPEQGATPMDFKSSSDQAAGTGVLCEDQEKKTPPGNCPLVICSIYGKKVQNWWIPAQVNERENENAFVLILPTCLFLVNSTIGWFLWELLLCPQSWAMGFLWPGHVQVHMWGDSELSSWRHYWVRQQWEGGHITVTLVSWLVASSTEVEKSFVTRIKAKYITLGEM